MSEANGHRDHPSPAMWLKAIYEAPDRPSPPHCWVLACLVLIANWHTMTATVSIADLARRAGCNKHTAQAATQWARDAKLLEVATLGNRGRATTWRLRIIPELTAPPPRLAITTGNGYGAQPSTATAADPNAWRYGDDSDIPDLRCPTEHRNRPPRWVVWP